MNRRVAFLIGLLFQLIAIFGLFLSSISLLTNGTPISLKTIPVDPRSIFRGDYVTLDYEAGALPVTADYEDPKPVFVVLEKKDDLYERVNVFDGIPELTEGQACIRGMKEYGRIRFPDIVQYFVEEGLGHELDDARNAHRLIVDAKTDAKCRAIIQGVRLGPEVPDSELPEWMRPMALPSGIEETKPAPAN